MQLLHIDSSISQEASASRLLTASLVREWRTREPGIRVVYRDLAADSLPHVALVSLPSRTAVSEVMTQVQRRDRALTEKLLREFLDSDVVVIGAPMYNFGLPTQLKAWVDRVVQAGYTFRYTENGPEGLVAEKKVVIVSTRGGIYAGESPYAVMDFQERYLISVLAFIGISDPVVVRAEGLAISPEQREQSMRNAHESIRSVVFKAGAAA